MASYIKEKKITPLNSEAYLVEMGLTLKIVNDSSSSLIIAGFLRLIE
jgi:hypothetical protein